MAIRDVRPPRDTNTNPALPRHINTRVLPIRNGPDTFPFSLENIPRRRFRVAVRFREAETVLRPSTVERDAETTNRRLIASVHVRT